MYVESILTLYMLSNKISKLFYVLSIINFISFTCLPNCDGIFHFFTIIFFQIKRFEPKIFSERNNICRALGLKPFIAFKLENSNKIICKSWINSTRMNSLCSWQVLTNEMVWTFLNLSLKDMNKKSILWIFINILGRDCNIYAI